MLTRRFDLPLDNDAVSRFLPWIIAFMVYLAILALAGTLILGAMVTRWDTGMRGSLTVQIPPAAVTGSGDGEKTAANDSQNIERVLGILRESPAVVRAELIGERQMLALLEPWLGKIGSARDLPLPYLIDVELKPGERPDMALLSGQVAKAAAGATIDDHKAWLTRLIRLIQTFTALAMTVVFLISLATVGTVVFATRTGLAIHQEVIEVLHHIGAEDSYMAQQFANHAMTLGLKGGLFGLLMAVPTLLGVGALASRLHGDLLPSIAIAPEHWAVLAGMPIAAALIAMTTARYTVTRSLSKMP
jgi:cell division transport system permease protein